MNIIKTSEYEDDYLCPICREKFKENDIILLVKHNKPKNEKPEKISDARKRKHIFHQSCIKEYIGTAHGDPICPLDREKIYCFISVRYYEIVALNIINFSHNYYELLDKCRQKGTMYVSVIDHINLNYKDINGKTIIYCACQRGNLKLVRQLIKMGSNPTISDDNGFTPLMAAINHNYIKIVGYLLTLPSVIKEINYVDNKGKTAIEYAQEYKRFQCIKRILTVDGLDHKILQNVLAKYQYIKKTDLGYDPMIIEIKNLLRRYLKLSMIKRVPITVSLAHAKTIICPKKVRDRDKILDVDITSDSALFNLIYQPMEHSKLIIPESNDHEIGQLLHFEQRLDNLIYTPQ